MSHDFVEAALLRRAGWEVRFGDDLCESYEEPPPTLNDYLARDRRWCQGNLQHLRLVLTSGLSPLSRLHLLFGAFSYMMSPLWLLFLMLFVVLAKEGGQAKLSFLPLTLGVLLLPKALSWIAALCSRKFGGASLVSLAVEMILFAWLAPVMMLVQTLFVFEIVLGLTVDWGRQQRDAATSFSPFSRRLLLVTLAGATAGSALALGLPKLLWLLAPIWLSWLSALGLSALAASTSLGRGLRQLGLLLTPSEVHVPAIIRSAERWHDYFHPDATARFRDVVLDPTLNARRRAQLQALGIAPRSALHAIADKAIFRGPAALSADERNQLLGDHEQLQRMHVMAWRQWPVETWNLPRPTFLTSA